MRVWENALVIRDDRRKRQQWTHPDMVLAAIRREWTRRAAGRRRPEDFFAWPSTDAAGGDGSLSGDDWLKEGLLSVMGYRVGVTNGQPTSLRRKVLDHVFEGPLPPVFEYDYMDQWGKPKTAARLQKLSETLSAFTRNAKRRRSDRLGCAIKDWESDLSYLYAEYYVGRFGFSWPRSYLD